MGEFGNSGAWLSMYPVAKGYTRTESRASLHLFYEMSAIFGWYSPLGRPLDQSVLERMKNMLAFADERPTLRMERCLTFGNCPWRITRDDAFDRQPISSPSGRYLLTADVRIYNRTEMISGLGLTVHPPDQIADSMLLLAAWERWQTMALARIEGDYAFALWDRETRILHLARDPFGHRPLVWHQGRDFFAFASLPKALLVLPEVPRALNRGRVADQLALLPQVGDDTLFQGIQRVLPGHRLENNEHGVRQFPCRCLDPDRRLVLASDDEYLEAFGEHLERAVRERLRTGKGIASHLSSGYDSSTVTAVAARLLAREGRRLMAFTAVPSEGFSGPVPKGRKGNEGPAARSLAERFPNIDHRLISVGAQSPLDGLHEANIAMDWPVLNPFNLLWTQRIKIEAAHGGANVLLTGATGNFTISHEGMGCLPAMVGSGRWWPWWREASALHRAGRRWRGLLSASFGPYLPSPIWRWIARLAGKETGELYRYSAIRADFAQVVRLNERARISGWSFASAPRADSRQLRISAIARVNGGNGSGCSGGVEMRDPTADFRLAEFCFAIPEDQFLRNGQTRWLLKRLMEDILPPEILFQWGGKGWQAADWYDGFQAARAEIGKWIEQLEDIPSAREVLDLERMRQIFEDWPAEGWDQLEMHYHRLILLRGLSMGSFIRYVEGTAIHSYWNNT